MVLSGCDNHDATSGMPIVFACCGLSKKSASCREAHWPCGRCVNAFVQIAETVQGVGDGLKQEGAMRVQQV